MTTITTAGAQLRYFTAISAAPPRLITPEEVLTSVLPQYAAETPDAVIIDTGITIPEPLPTNKQDRSIYIDDMITRLETLNRMTLTDPQNKGLRVLLWSYAVYKTGGTP